ncbi:CCA-adding enzyme [Pectobacterium brasiliense]|uniref:hypothetical protein n=1 Tax=Pectobacterium brasiliense TaxID=180957 RepID=UPI000CE68EDD|nr:hypothetical protein [Pectobacterium brasiliense]PPE57479.1 CCA-adding enzyme [Pectobacterium brasiliense]
MMDNSKLIELVSRKLFNWIGYPIFKELFLDNSTSPVYISGGALRNSIMKTDNEIKDYDFFIDTEDYYEKIRTLKKYGKVLETPYGAPRWYPENCSIYADIMPIKSFTPGLWKCLDITDVLNQFDFTMNAIALELRTLKLFDPVNGIRDASEKKLKMVRFDYPTGPFLYGQKIDRNAVLWIRAIHYASVYNLEIEPITFSWMKKNREFKDSIHLFSEVFFKPEQDFLLKGLI